MPGVGGLSHLWSQWGIQIVVLASFALQVFLLAFGGIRRRSSSAVLRIALWLAYLSADSTAIYALGHISLGSRSNEEQLVAFWAPFLLLHLGGPDNITAYSLEDNRLWLRHLQTLAVQAVGAAYVIYRYMTGTGTLLLLATIAMFVAGLVKYGERIWALKCADISSIGSTGTTQSFETLLDQRSRMSDEEGILIGAHSHFDICKGVFSGLTMKSDSPVNLESNRADKSSVKAYLQRNVYKLVEMELSLMYDVLYTKAAVIHTWYGMCLHFISLLGTATAFLLFQLSISSRGNGYRRADVVISYVLLAGALVLEAMSLCRALVSTWTCSFLDRRGKGWEWLLHVVTSLRRRVRPARRRLWPGSIGQFSLLHMCTSDRNDIRSRLAKKIGLEDWWNKLHFSSTYSGTNSLSVEDLKLLVLREIKLMARRRDTTDSAAMDTYDLAYYNQLNVDGTDFDRIIIESHIATDLCIRWESRLHDAQVDHRLIEATKVLSNYMMFLLLVQPELLPGRTRTNVYHNACKGLDSCWSRCTQKLSASKESLPRTASLADWLVDWSHNDMKLLGDGRALDIHVYDPERREYEKLPEHVKDVYRAAWSARASWSAHGPDNMERHGLGVLHQMFKKWVKMMLYVAEHCSRDSHARQLSNGGEFITIVWLMVHHLNYYSIPAEAIPMLYTSAPLPEDSSSKETSESSSLE